MTSEIVYTPAQPGLFVDISYELNRDEPDFKKIGEIIKKDAFLKTHLVMIANSPFFGLRAVDTVETALNVLTLRDINQIVMISTLRKSLGGKGYLIERIWEHAMLVARSAEFIAKKVNYRLKSEYIPLDYAYLAGIFHDGAIPLFLLNYPDYVLLLDNAISSDTTVIGSENDRYKTNHSMVSHMLAKSWNLPHIVIEACRYHHDDEINTNDVTPASMLRAALYLADTICYNTIQAYVYDVRSSASVLVKQMLSILTLDDEDYKDLEEDIVELLRNI